MSECYCYIILALPAEHM
uniref:Uncharacterized protein n=1 Tax=Anguilla anguilla TaxID=7936 RepID=A0A0E9S1K4_ANGAN